MSRRNPKLTGDDRNTVARGIAARTGRSYGLVHALLPEAGVQLRPRGGNPARRPADGH